jgi:hypothetical protein
LWTRKQKRQPIAHWTGFCPGRLRQAELPERLLLRFRLGQRLKDLQRQQVPVAAAAPPAWWQ